MEYYWTPLNNSNSNTNGIGSSTSTSSSVRGHNGSFTPAPAPAPAWDLPPTSTRPEWTFYTAAGATPNPTPSSSLYNCNPVVDPHLTCLKLGKRHYFEDPAAASGMPKKGKSADAVVPRCQVEGCEALLVNAKDYHRRHKVCEMHAKAPKVVLLGIEQRFCQQCSRFHAVAEFDEAKRSCRRRLAGHNERRRKTSQPDHKHYQLQGRQAQYPPSQLVNNGECALSLLSPTNYASDLPARCSAALRELIAENRASYNQLNRSHVTLNLMQGPDSAFGLLSSEPEEDDCSHLWKLPLGY